MCVCGFAAGYSPRGPLGLLQGEAGGAVRVLGATLRRGGAVPRRRIPGQEQGLRRGGVPGLAGQELRAAGELAAACDGSGSTEFSGEGFRL